MSDALHILFGVLTTVALLLGAWQYWAAQRFPLHQRQPLAGPAPGVTVLKPLEDCGAAALACLRGWLSQEYPGPLQILAGIASEEDLPRDAVSRLQAEFPDRRVEWIACPQRLGANAKASVLAQLQEKARHDRVVVSAADVMPPPDLLAQVVPPLADPSVGAVTCFSRLASPSGLAMRWEAITVNADFWSHVLQSRTIHRTNFLLNGVVAARRSVLDHAQAWRTLVDDLADHCQLGHRIARNGGSILLSPVVVDCVLPASTWAQAWQRQLDWACALRCCRLGSHALSILGNMTFWPLLWLLASLSPHLVLPAMVCIILRIHQACYLEALMFERQQDFRHAWLVPIKDLLQVALWTLSLARRKRRRPFP